MNTSIQIGKVMGIPIKIHISFLLVLILFPVIFSREPTTGFANVEQDPLRYALSLILTLLLFLCVALHELGHSWVARRYGITIKSITLIIFGGIAAMDEVPRNPDAELRISLAGPGVSLVIGVFCAIVYLILHNIAQASQTSVISDVSHLLWSLATINIMLFGFNLIPAFPMDGGRVVRAWYAQRMPYLRATRKAVHLGKMIAILMGVFGLFASIWLLFIAFFIYIGASEEEKFTEASVTLEGVKVNDLMTRDVAYVTDDMTILELLQVMFGKKHRAYPVIDHFTREVVGMVAFADVQSVPMDKHNSVLVRDVMTTDIKSIFDDADAVDALKMISIHRIGHLLVKNRITGAVTGIISRTDLTRSIEVLGYSER
ncbi:MAG TPA: CBS domain-containing protein [Methanosarcinales archaeon]|nr:CBS domain-containing protein [Methanosarcinales archaeon]